MKVWAKYEMNFIFLTTLPDRLPSRSPLLPLLAPPYHIPVLLQARPKTPQRFQVLWFTKLLNVFKDTHVGEEKHSKTLTLLNSLVAIKFASSLTVFSL